MKLSQGDINGVADPVRSGLFAIAAARKAKWIVAGIWLAVFLGSFALDLPGRFADAEQNENVDYLPASAESTEALGVTERLNDGDVASAIVVYRRDGGLTPADRAAIAADVAALNRTTRAFDNTTPFGAPVVSRDGTTALVQNQVKVTGEDDDILYPVAAYRDVVDSAPGGLNATVSGPAGVSADAREVFDTVDGTLVGAALALVIVLLILIYRSPIFWIFPIVAVVCAEIAGRGAGWLLSELGVTITGQSSSILSVLVIGAGTDYALLLVARYREELRRHEDRHEAMVLALRRAGPAIFASGLTVAVALLALTLADVNSTSGAGLLGAVGITIAMVTMLTLLPALLLLVGRRPFWPDIPRYGGEGADETHGLWRRIGERVSAHPHRTAIVAGGALVLMALGLVNYSNGLTQSNGFRDSVDSIEGQKLIAEAFPEGQAAPTDIVVRDASRVAEVARAAAAVPGVAEVLPRPVARGPEGVQLTALLRPDPYSTAAFETIEPLRAAVRSADPGALVGGPTAVEHDLRDANAGDTRLLVPLTLVIVLAILVGLLRALVAPLVLVATVILSFFASLGVGAVVFDVVFGFPGAAPDIPLFAFVFLVALGVDYNIFLMARVREEALRHGTGQGMLRGLAVTGGVITSAGVVLAGTFAVLGVLPLVLLTELGFLIAFGVLLDTFVVRSLLVPAITFETGPRIWRPSSIDQARRRDRRARATTGH
jgi:putative drug exporter of the RND superfamily